MDLLKTTRQLKPVRGQRLASWLQRFLIAQPDNLNKWSGSFTEVVTAKVVAILRKRGVVEEAEADQSWFGQLQNACYRAEVYRPEATPTGSQTSVNP